MLSMTPKYNMFGSVVLKVYNINIMKKWYLKDKTNQKKILSTLNSFFFISIIHHLSGLQAGHRNIFGVALSDYFFVVKKTYLMFLKLIFF